MRMSLPLNPIWKNRKVIEEKIRVSEKEDPLLLICSQFKNLKKELKKNKSKGKSQEATKALTKRDLSNRMNEIVIRNVIV